MVQDMAYPSLEVIEQDDLQSLLPYIYQPQPGQARIQRVGLDTGYILDNAQALLQDFDPELTIEDLELSFFQHKDKNGLYRQLQAIYVAIWALALGSSFPLDYLDIFTEFLWRHDQLPGKIQSKRQQAEQIIFYTNKLWRMKEIDFSDLARHLLTFVRLNDKEARAVSMKLALHFRKAYQHFFDHLL